MAVLQVLHIPDERLRKVATPVKEVNAEIQRIVDDMFETMYDAPGIGLAAPQVNVSKRIFTVDLQDGKPEHGPFAVVNPKFDKTEGEIEWTEGCLSVPGYVGEVTRFEKVRVSGLDRHGKRIVLDGEGLFAICLQHEIDHLNGVLYIDKVKDLRPAQSDEELEAAERAASLP